MATFTGFNTQAINQVRGLAYSKGITTDGGMQAVPQVRTTKKFRLTDRDLIIQDFINALNIPLGQKPGRPDYGTTMWNFVFEPNTIDVQNAIEEELQRVVSLDPRLEINSIVVYAQDNGILVELEVYVTPFDDLVALSVLFDQNTNKALGI